MVVEWGEWLGDSFTYKYKVHRQQGRAKSGMSANSHDNQPPVEGRKTGLCSEVRSVKSVYANLRLRGSFNYLRKAIN